MHLKHVTCARILNDSRTSTHSESIFVLLTNRNLEQQRLKQIFSDSFNLRTLNDICFLNFNQFYSRITEEAEKTVKQKLTEISVVSYDAISLLDQIKTLLKPNKS